MTPPDLPTSRAISLIEASPHEPATAYVAANRYQLGDRAPYLYRTDDYGEDVDEDRRRHPGRRLHARRSARTRSAPACSSPAPSTACRSRSTTAPRWQSLRLNLPVVPVHDLVVKTATSSSARTAAASGSSTTSALRQARPRSRPRRCTCSRRCRRSGAFAAAPIDYYLGRGGEGHDGNSRRRRRRCGSSRASPEGREEAGRRRGADGGATGREGSAWRSAARRHTKAGMNRFQWDMRLPPGATFPGLIMWARAPRGPIALPGGYRCR